LLRRLLTAAHHQRRALGLPPRQRLRLLDLGTGYGRDLAWLQSQRGLIAFGIDYSLSMLRAARHAVRLAPGSLAQMDVRTLGIQTASLDVARAQALFHHLPPRAANAAMREVARVLKPGGLVRIFVRTGRKRGLLTEPGLGSRYFNYFTLTALRRLVERHGLRLLEHEWVTAYPHLPCLAVLAEKPVP